MRRQDIVLAPSRDQSTRAFRQARRTGVLNLPNRRLDEFPSQVYHLEEHLEKDEKKWECVDLIKIDMSHNNIQSISDEIGEIATLQSLKLHQNEISNLPDGLYDLSDLVFLDVSSNKLQGEISERVGQLVALKELCLSNNQISVLPDSIGGMTQLEALRIDSNLLQELPESMSSLSKLHTLTASSNRLKCLPSWTAFDRLQTLDMSKNQIEDVGSALTHLTKVTYLDLRQNRLASFPLLPQSSVLDQLFLGFNNLTTVDALSLLQVKQGLTVLDLRDNKIKALPGDAARLVHMKTLDVSNNDLSDLPPGLGYLKHLQHLSVDGNPLRSIRRGIVSSGCQALKKYLRTRGSPPVGETDVLEEEMDELAIARQQHARPDTPGELSNSFAANDLHRLLRDTASSGKLALCSQQLHELPHQIFSLPSDDIAVSTPLFHLDVSDNLLKALPLEVSNLTSLITLKAENNSISSVGFSIDTLPKLQVLQLRKNKLSSEEVNKFIGGNRIKSSSLKELDLRNNQLVKMPSSIHQLESLESLLLSYNKIDTLDTFPWHCMKHLSVASISDNKLRSVGDIHDSPQLTSLSIENNNLTSIPCELALCPNLRAIYINGNPQKTVRGAVIAQGSQAILQYLKTKLPIDTNLHPPKSYVQESMATIDTEQLRPPEHEPTVESGHLSLNQDSSSSSLSILNSQIDDIADQLENPSLSGPKKYALKKELAKLRARRIRQTRQRSS